MPDGAQFAYSAFSGSIGESELRPMLPLMLAFGDRSLTASGLLDTGAAVNVLPYSLGLTLGAIWSEQKASVRLTGNLSAYEARGLIVIAEVAHFAPVKLAFA
jgi:hypothetical protein